MAAADIRPTSTFPDGPGALKEPNHPAPVVATTSQCDDYIEACARSNERASRDDVLSRLFAAEKLQPAPDEEKYTSVYGFERPASKALRARLTKCDQCTIETSLYQSSLARGRAKVARGAFVVEAGEFSAFAVWEPNFAPPPYGQDGTALVDSPLEVPFPERLIFSEFLMGIEKLKRQHLYPILWEAQRSQKPYRVLDEWTARALEKRPTDKNVMYWYLGLMSRSPLKPPVKGAVRAVVEPFIKRWVDQAGMPVVWLEAGSPRARDVYAHFGFRCVGEVVVGEDSDGKGISTWCMMYTKS